MKLKLLSISLIVVVLVSSCGNNENMMVMTGVASTEIANQFIEQKIEKFMGATATYLASLPTPNPTITITPTIEITPSPSPTLIPLIKIITDGTIIRNGPGTNYRIAQYVVEGDECEVIGQDITGFWLAIDSGLENPGWVRLASVKFELNTDSLLILEPPPTPNLVVARVSAINNSNSDIYLILINLETNYEFTFYLEPGISTFNNIPQGNYRVIVGVVGGENCGLESFSIYGDIHWEPYVPNICNQFP